MKTFADFDAEELLAMEEVLKKSRKRSAVSARKKLTLAIKDCIEENEALYPMGLFGPDAYETGPHDEDY